MPEYNNLEPKLEALFQTLLRAAIPSGCHHFTGQTSDDLSLPRTWSWARDFAEHIPQSSIHRGIMEIGVQSLALTDPDEDSPLPGHQALIASVRDAIIKSTLVNDLNLLALDAGLEITIIDVLNPHFVEDEQGPIPFTNLLHLDVVAANAAI